MTSNKGKTILRNYTHHPPEIVPRRRLRTTRGVFKSLGLLGYVCQWWSALDSHSLPLGQCIFFPPHSSQNKMPDSLSIFSCQWVRDSVNVSTKTGFAWCKCILWCESVRQFCQPQCSNYGSFAMSVTYWPKCTSPYEHVYINLTSKKKKNFDSWNLLKLVEVGWNGVGFSLQECNFLPKI